LIDEKSQASLHEADWYRRSIETNKDHRNDVKQIRLNEKQYVSQTQFDHRQANLIENHCQCFYQLIFYLYKHCRIII